MRPAIRSLFAVLPLAAGLLLAACPKKEEAVQQQPPPNTTTAAAAATTTEEAHKLINLMNDAGVASLKAATRLRVDKGDQAGADNYYNGIRAKLTDFPKTKLQDSTLDDMLAYFGYAELRPSLAEQLDPAGLMKEGLIPGVKTGDILCTRFFAPKIINVGAPQVNGVPKGGFGWRKVLRLRALDGSKARRAGLDAFFLLFNMNSDTPVFPKGKFAGQIQGILQPVYPGSHRDLYFLVFEARDAANPYRIRGFLEASFDLAGIGENSKYFVPVACAQCHGAGGADDKGAKINYLDTDHWIDRTEDDFTAVKHESVIVDGAPAYDTFRKFNELIKTQNEAVGGKGQFAWLATSKWLELHDPKGADATHHVPPLRRGFVAQAGDKNWTAEEPVDRELLPLLNQYCYRCHSSVVYHVFQKQAVFDDRGTLASYVDAGIMPQDRKLDAATKAKLIDLLNRMK
ncbi:MAG: hypothetical protein QOI24_4281 [Acidobacteriota bacterium]|jgi:mono/diheme cytochrome c family protein|nr:hypothetical protein [Acidobacteriota bacterium]